jgi:WD40-like Beta Propeller Repeat
MKQQVNILVIIFLVFDLSACQISKNDVSNSKVPETAVDGLAYEQSSTAIKPPIKTETPTPFLTITPTATLTVIVTPTTTHTPIPIPNMRVIYFDNGTLMGVEPPAQPFKILETNRDPGNYIPMDYMQFSGDGKKIAFFGIVRLGLVMGMDVINFDGSGFKFMLTYEDIEGLEKVYDPDQNLFWEGITSFNWVRGKSRLLFTTDYVFYNGNHWKFDNLFSIDADTGIILKLRSRDKGGFPSPSPDGKKLALSQCEAISLSLINGGILHEKVITFKMEDFQCNHPTVVWTPDSSRIGTLIPSGESVAVWSVDASTGIATILGNLEQNIESVLSPNLDCIADLSLGADSPPGFPYLVPMEGSASVRLLKMGSSHFISFSPDGKHFAFSKDSSASNPTLYIGSLDDSVALLSQVQYPKLFHWVNNLQFVYFTYESIQLGDVYGNSTLLATITSSGEDWLFDAKDLDFQMGEK